MEAVLLSALCVSLCCFAESKVLYKSDTDFRMDPEDCSTFYILRDGKEFSFKCPDDFVVNAASRSCVPKGSPLDTCIQILQSTEGNCTFPSDKKLEYAENCARYYDCENKILEGNPKLTECPFPLLFDVESQRCDHFSMVQCGTRYEPKDACDYEDNHCRSAHCIPCHVRFPSCKGSPDGLNPWRGRERSPYFVVCQDERVVFQGRCPSAVDDKPRIFHPVHNMCVEHEEDD
ncbi:uncharacterized protein LOC125653602 [Ostrea edulis]|uniref:uncharacterized protein LOC125653602 n=1 Tax=Ostrea edulis TaxID=37623 RepID=UPI0024AF3502|nr:uncharacterized protein LOC125653602 [Ostrea edulis]